MKRSFGSRQLLIEQPGLFIFKLHSAAFLPSKMVNRRFLKCLHFVLGFDICKYFWSILLHGILHNFMLGTLLCLRCDSRLISMCLVDFRSKWFPCWYPKESTALSYLVPYLQPFFYNHANTWQVWSLTHLHLMPASVAEECESLCSGPNNTSHICKWCAVVLIVLATFPCV